MAHLGKLRAVGQSWVIGIPRELCRELHWPPGTYLVIRRTRDGGVTLRRLEDHLDARPSPHRAHPDQPD